MTEKEREYHKKYREEHKAEISEYRKQYYSSHPEQREKAREYKRLRYQRLKNDAEYIAKSRANHAKWQRENKDKINAYHRERRKLTKLKGGN